MLKRFKTPTMNDSENMMLLDKMIKMLKYAIYNTACIKIEKEQYLKVVFNSVLPALTY